MEARVWALNGRGDTLRFHTTYVSAFSSTAAFVVMRCDVFPFIPQPLELMKQHRRQLLHGHKPVQGVERIFEVEELVDSVNECRVQHEVVPYTCAVVQLSTTPTEIIRT